MTTVTKSELADHLGVHRSRITALVKRGLPFTGREIELDVAVAWLKANLSQQAGWQDRGIHKVLTNGLAAKQAKDGRKAPRATTIAPTPVEAGPAPLDEAVLDDETAALPYATAKAMRETFLARKAKLEYLKEHGKLLAADIVESRWSKIFTSVRNRVLACPGRIGAKIPHLSPAEIGTIDKELHAALNELGEAPR